MRRHAYRGMNMGQARMGNEQPSLRYLQQLGVSPSRDLKAFIQHIERRHGRDIANKIAAIVSARGQGRGQMDELYMLKNSSLALSLDFLHFSADLYRRFFDWFTMQDWPNVKSILDIGCDNGFAACFYALHFPDAQITGVDVSEVAVVRARELAKKLNLTNVRFEVHDFSLPGCPEVSGGYDVVVSLRSLVEMMPEVNDVRYWSLEDLKTRLDATDTECYGVLKVANRVAPLLSEKGKVVTCERLTHAGALYAWLYAGENRGLQVAWDSMTWLSFHEVGVHQRFPVVYMTPRGNSSSDLIERTYAFLDRGLARQLELNSTLYDDAAALAFRASQEAKFDRGVWVKYPNHAGEERREIWVYPRGVLVFARTDKGYRELTLHPFEQLEQERVKLMDWTKLRALDNCVCHSYDKVTR